MRALRVLGSGARLLRGGRGAAAAGAGAAARLPAAAWAGAPPPRGGAGGGWGVLLPWAATAGARAMSAGTLPDHRRITMPKLSPTMEVGTIASWRKAEGDAIDENDVLAEIDTDKASMEYTYSDTGFLAKVGGGASALSSGGGAVGGGWGGTPGSGFCRLFGRAGGETRVARTVLRRQVGDCASCA